MYYGVHDREGEILYQTRSRRDAYLFHKTLMAKQGYASIWRNDERCLLISYIDDSGKEAHIWGSELGKLELKSV